jgi:hypothetical protein
LLSLAMGRALSRSPRRRDTSSCAFCGDRFARRKVSPRRNGVIIQWYDRETESPRPSAGFGVKRLVSPGLGHDRGGEWIASHEAKEMAVTREIPTTDWKAYLQTFEKLNAGRLVRLETAIPPGEGEPVLGEHQPLIGMELEFKGSDSPAIIITLGDPETQTPSLTHIIQQPTRLWVEEDDGGLARAVQIESREEGKTLLLFEVEQALPETGTR